jgi:hypothetical protein
MINRGWNKWLFIDPPLHIFERLIGFPLCLHQFVDSPGFNPDLMRAPTSHRRVILFNPVAPRVPPRVMCTRPQLIARVNLHRLLFDVRATMCCPLI